MPPVADTIHVPHMIGTSDTIRMPDTGEPALAQPSTSDKMTRYLVVTAVATPANFLLFALGFLALGLPAIVSNVLAATVVSIPTYIASRRWVWQVDRLTSRRGEAAQYWSSTMVSLAAATLALFLLEGAGAGSTVLVMTPFGVYTVLWLVRYLFLDKYLFRRAAA